MNNTKKSEEKSRFFTKKKIIVITLVIVVLLISISLYFYNSSIYWDNGKWENTTTIPSNDKGYTNPIFIEYNGRIYGFFSFTSKSTYTGSDAITPDQYSLSDITYRTFDGEDWGSELLLSNTSDETSESISDAVIYNETIYVVRYKSTREVINNDESDWDNIIWNTTILLQSFDGNNWGDHNLIILPEERGDRCGLPDLVVWQDKIWAIWKSNVYYEYNQYSYKSFDGNNWSLLRNFTMPTQKTNDCVFLIFNNELWATWHSAVVGYFDHTDIYLGKFNGVSMELIAKMTEDENDELICRPHIASYNGKIYVSWEGKEGILCRSYSNGKLEKTMHVDNGMEVFSVVYNDKLYLLYQSYRSFSGDPDFYIKSYDGNKWSNSYQLTSGSYPGTDYPKAFAFKDKLYVYWESRINGKHKIAIKEYNR